MNEECIKFIETLSHEEFFWLVETIIKKIEEEKLQDMEWKSEHIFRHH